MKTSFRVLTAIALLGLVLLLGVHLFLQYGLTRAMHDVILPRVKAETGFDVGVGKLSINVPGGVLYLKELTVRNPEGFLLENMVSIDRVRLEVDIISLFKQDPVLIRNIEIEQGLLNVIRNKEGEVNVAPLAGAASMPDPEQQDSRRPVEQKPAPTVEDAVGSGPDQSRELPEILIRGISCNVTVRYLDFRFNQLDLSLDLGIIGSDLSTLRDPDAPWGHVAFIGSLGNNRNRFVTDLQVDVAPLVQPAEPSFDLTGKVLEIDPSLMNEICGKLGIRTAPFGLDPELHCREGRFERSVIAIHLRDVQFEEKLSRRLGGMASIQSLRFPLKVEGTLQSPTLNLQDALMAAISGNTPGLLDSLLKGAAAKEAGLEAPPGSMSEAAVEVLGAHVEEIGQNQAAKQALKDLVDGKPAETNSGQGATDVLVDILAEEIDEIGENKEVKEGLKNLGRMLFGE